VLPPEVRAEFRASHTLATDTNDLGILHQLLRRQTELLGRRLRPRTLAARRLTVAIDYVDYASSARGLPLPAAALDVELWDAARRALALAMTRRLAIRQVTVTVDRLIEANLQLEFWQSSSPRSHLLQQALDRIQKAKREKRQSTGECRMRHAQ
jgi:DNA polymerase-4